MNRLQKWVSRRLPWPKRGRIYFTVASKAEPLTPTVTQVWYQLCLIYDRNGQDDNFSSVRLLPLGYKMAEYWDPYEDLDNL